MDNETKIWLLTNFSYHVVWKFENYTKVKQFVYGVFVALYENH